MLVALALNQFAERLARVTSCRCTVIDLTWAYKQAVPREINPQRAHLTELGHSKIRSLRVLDQNVCRVNLVRRGQRIHEKDEELWAMITSFFLFIVIIT